MGGLGLVPGFGAVAPLAPLLLVLPEVGAVLPPPLPELGCVPPSATEPTEPV